MTSIVDGVLLTRGGAVHCEVGQRTRCGTYIPDRSVAVSAIQAAAYRLPVCAKCYPTNHDSMRGVRTW